MNRVEHGLSWSAGWYAQAVFPWQVANAIVQMQLVHPDVVGGRAADAKITGQSIVLVLVLVLDSVCHSRTSTRTTTTTIRVMDRQLVDALNAIDSHPCGTPE